jgi:hypothetical protein
MAYAALPMGKQRLMVLPDPISGEPPPVHATTLSALIRKIARQTKGGDVPLLPFGLSEQLLQVPELLDELLYLFNSEFEKAKPDRKLLTICGGVLGEVMHNLAQGGKGTKAPARHLQSTLQGMLKAGEAHPAFMMELMHIAYDSGFNLGIDLPGKAPAPPPMPERREDQEQMLLHAFTNLLEEAKGDIFRVYEQMAPMIAATPVEARAAMGAVLLANHESTPLRELGLVWLLDEDASVRKGTADLLRQTAEMGLLPPVSLRRLILLRNMLPDDLRPVVDATIRAARLKGIDCPAIAAAPAPELVAASGFDGAGAQSLFIVMKQGRKYAIASLLLKQGIGIKDAWTNTGMTRKAAFAMLEQIEDQVGLLESDGAYLETALSHFLATGLAAGTPPPFGLLEVLEALALPPPAPAIQDIAALLDGVLATIPTERQNAAALEQAIQQSASWPDQFAFAQSWFEDIPAVDGLLRGRRLGQEKQTLLILSQLLPQRRTHWAGLLGWTAAACAHDKVLTDLSIDLALVARAVLNGADLTGIPIMQEIAGLTVLAWRHQNGKR